MKTCPDKGPVVSAEANRLGQEEDTSLISISSTEMADTMTPERTENGSEALKQRLHSQMPESNLASVFDLVSVSPLTFFLHFKRTSD